MIDPYLADKIAAHVAAILDEYISNPDDVCLAASEIMDAIEQELAWAGVPVAAAEEVVTSPPTG